MWDDHYTYLLINIFTIVPPLLMSFDKKVAFYKNWKFLFPSIFFTAVVFIIWDIFKTALGVWDFNPKYLIGIYIVNLPIEEWMFFFTIPYAVMFIYECLIAYFKDIFYRPAPYITIVVLLLLLAGSVFYYDRIYTIITFPFTFVFLLIHHFVLGRKVAGKFWFTYFVHLIPFLIVNGILTALPVVTYNDAENIGCRIFTIPVEDTIYSMLLLLMNVTIYERLKQHSPKS